MEIAVVAGENMNSIKKTARFAGLLYLLASLPAPLGVLYVPSKLIVSGDATATANHLRASEALLRLGIASELFSSVAFIFVALALYWLFKRVNEKQALAMAILILMSVPISLVNVLNDVAALLAVDGANFQRVFNQDQLDALAYLFLRLHLDGFMIAGIFWGLWLFPFGLLVIRSGFIPRFLGVLLFVAGCGYLAGSVSGLIFPAYRHFVHQFADVLMAGELPIIFWLLIWGAKERAVEPAA